MRSEFVERVIEWEGVFFGTAGKGSKYEDCEFVPGLRGGDMGGESAMPIVVSAVGGRKAGWMWSKLFVSGTSSSKRNACMCVVNGGDGCETGDRVFTNDRVRGVGIGVLSTDTKPPKRPLSSTVEQWRSWYSPSALDSDDIALDSLHTWLT